MKNEILNQCYNYYYVVFQACELHATDVVDPGEHFRAIAREIVGEAIKMMKTQSTTTTNIENAPSTESKVRFINGISNS